MPTTSSQQKETKMSNVETFKTTRQSTQTALVVVDQMSPKEALMMHTSVKSQGRGAVKSFIKNETPYDSYWGYYYELKKKGVVPFNPKGPKNKISLRNPLELRIEQLEMQLAISLTSPAKRAMTLLQENLEHIVGKSRRFLCDVVCYDRASLTPKQEKWMSDLEESHS
jgi:hypothetical protein